MESNPCDHIFRFDPLTQAELDDGGIRAVGCCSCDFRVVIDGSPLNPEEQLWADGVVSRLQGDS